jgi:hypothetical protein
VTSSHRHSTEDFHGQRSNALQQGKAQTQEGKGRQKGREEVARLVVNEKRPGDAGPFAV